MSSIRDAMLAHIHDVPNHPKPGIIFKDITPLLANTSLFRSAVGLMAYPYDFETITHVVSMEARGFMLGSALAYKLGSGFVPARKAGKLPRAVHTRKYDLEYGQDSLEIHQGVLKKGDRVLVADDFLATGETARAVAEMVEETGATLVGFTFLAALTGLPGWNKLRRMYGDLNVHTVLSL